MAFMKNGDDHIPSLGDSSVLCGASLGGCVAGARWCGLNCDRPSPKSLSGSANHGKDQRPDSAYQNVLASHEIWQRISGNEIEEIIGSLYLLA